MGNTKLLSLACLMGFFGPLGAELSEKPQEMRAVKFALHENMQASEPYTIRYNNKPFVVHPDVFSPKYFPDTFWFEKNLPIKPGDSFLEIGSGAGVIAVMAAIKGAAEVTTVDINPAAVQNTTENVFLNHVANKFHIYEGDLFDPIPKGQTFDVIFWFAPFMHIDMQREHLTALEHSVYDPSYRSLKIYLSEAKRFLKPQGRLYLGINSTHGEFDVLEKLAKNNDMKIYVLAQEETHIPSIPGVAQPDSSMAMLLELKSEKPAPAQPAQPAKKKSTTFIPSVSKEDEQSQKELPPLPKKGKRGLW